MQERGQMNYSESGGRDKCHFYSHQRHRSTTAQGYTGTTRNTKEKTITFTYAGESHMHFNTNPAGSHRPSPSALGPLAGDSYDEEMLFSESPGTSADFSELYNMEKSRSKIRTQRFVCRRNVSLVRRAFSHKEPGGAQSFKNIGDQQQSWYNNWSGKNLKLVAQKSPT